MLIRPEKLEEFSSLRDFVQTAFLTAKVSDGSEQDFVEVLREGVNYLPELALVAEADGQIIAHIMFTKTYFSVAGERFEALLLAPVSVALKERGKGVGSVLIREGLARAKAAGFSSVFLIGDPDYYARFGFLPASQYGIHHQEAMLEKYVMAIELVPQALAGVKGTLEII